METKKMTPNHLEEAVKLLQEGELVAFPTETVYGLGADATNAEAVKKVYQAKGRPSDNPLIVHVGQIEDIFQYVENVPDYLMKLLTAFWPGPLTVVLKVKKNSFPKEVTGGLETAGFRMPQQKVTLELINQLERPIVGPSANNSGKPSPTSADHVFHDLNGKIAGIVDDGPTAVGIESTVLDLSYPTEIPIILRPGAITQEQLFPIIGPVLLDPHLANEKEQPKSPGMKYKHYAPNAQVWIVDKSKENWEKAIHWGKKNQLKIGLLADEEIVQRYKSIVEDTAILTLNHQVDKATQNLFSGLRKLDEVGVSVIFVESFPEEGLGIAYMNRLKKAANGNIFKM